MTSALWRALLATSTLGADGPPNIVVLFADDLGYGDLACYGHPTIRTPHLDEMAAQGMRFTQFYSAACVCTPSRAALLTGRLPIRSGMCSDNRRVLFPNSLKGLPESETTLAEALKQKGYATACFGKWHLGHRPQYLPTRNGFDRYFGVPYSNDMDHNRETGVFNCPILSGEEEVERPAQQTTLTKRYTEHALAFMRENKRGPFFLYLPYTFPHVPLFASKQFRDSSRRGLFGDVVEEIDWSVGRILQLLRDENLAENTLVFFTSDNGPWLTKKQNGGSAGLLRDGKGCTWEGGMREPALAWWPGKIKPGTVTAELASTLDVFPTAVKLAGGEIPQDRSIDGYDLTEFLTASKPSPRQEMFYYRGTRLMAARLGPWKAHFATQPAYGQGSRKVTEHDPPLLFHLEHDPSERFNLAAQNSSVIEQITKLVADHRKSLDAPPTQLDAVVAR